MTKFIHNNEVFLVCGIPLDNFNSKGSALFSKRG